MAEASGGRLELHGIPTITAEESLAIDEALGQAGVRIEAVVNRVGYVSAQLITNDLREQLLAKEIAESVITVLAGTGNKGAAAMACGRNLADAGATVNVVLARQPKEYSGAAKEALDKLTGVAKKVYKGYNERAFEQADVIVDGLIGVGITGKPRASVSLLIKGANFSMKPIVALDIPSGLDPSTGVQSPVTMKAAATFIVGIPKRGLLGESNLALCGDIWLVDAGIPPNVFADMEDLAVGDLFEGRDYVHLAGR